MGKKDSSQEERVARWQSQRNAQQPQNPSFLSRALKTGAVVIIGGSLVIGAIGTGLYLQDRYTKVITENPAIHVLGTIDEIGKGILQDINDLGNNISSLGFIAGTRKFISDDILIPYNTIIPIYGNPIVIPINDVYVATDTYMVLGIDQATNQLFGDLFKVIPETVLQYNGTEPIIIYDINNTVTPAAITEKHLNSGETLTVQGVAIQVQPRLNTGQITIQRQAAAHISYNFYITYQKPSDMVIPEFAGTSLEELQKYLSDLGQSGIEYNLSTTLNSINLDTRLSLTLEVPPVTVNTVPLTNTQYENPTLNKIDQLMQQAWPIPGVSTLEDALSNMSNRNGITSAFQQMYLNVPGWTAQAKAMPGYQDLPLAVLPTISEPSANITIVPMPSYFPQLWADTTSKEIIDIYLEIVKLTVNAGVTQPIICTSDPNQVTFLSTGGTDNPNYLQDNNITLLRDCKISEYVTMNVNVPPPYAAGLQQRVDTYLAGIQSEQPGVYDRLEIIVKAAPAP